MSALLLSLGILVLALWLAACLLLRTGILSPLLKVPAPHWSCHISALWFGHACASKGELKTLYASHQRLGPIVRLAPNEVSIVSEEGLKKVYTAGLDKSDWYKKIFPVYGVQNLVCTLDHATPVSYTHLTLPTKRIV